jgi:hypothetical protein
LFFICFSYFYSVGVPLYKQLKIAIIEGNEEKAVAVYQSKEMGKTLSSTLHPSKPFPSKKDPNGESPLHMAVKAAFANLVDMFLVCGGRPDIVNGRQENCLHAACSLPSFPLKRADLVEQLLKWGAMNPLTNKLVTVPLDACDIDGNNAAHLAAYNGLLLCAEKLIWAMQPPLYKQLNNLNLTCAEYADINGHSNIGSMLELFWLFRDDPEEIGESLGAAEDKYRLTLRQTASTPNGIISIGSHSLTLAGFISYVSFAIAVVSKELKETPARAEMLLMSYSWDAVRLCQDYSRSPEAVLSQINLRVRSEASTTSQVDVLSGDSASESLVVRSCDNVPIGVPIGEVYLDSAYEEIGPFTVYRDGKKVSYTIRTVGGKTAVVPLDFDPHAKLLTNNDQNVSANSHVRPDTTIECPMCGELMFEPASVQHFLDYANGGTLVEPRHRELQCGSGHRHCFSCWSRLLQSQVADEGLHCLRCPAKNCGEMLDLQWAPVLLNGADLVDRMHAQRQRKIMDGIKLQWCPFPMCGTMVHVHTTGNTRGPSCTAGSVSQCSVCSNGHGFCLCCSAEAHSPCTCSELGEWQRLAKSMIKYADSSVQTNPANILLHAPTHRDCPQCGMSNGKESGSNHMR